MRLWLRRLDSRRSGSFSSKANSKIVGLTPRVVGPHGSGHRHLEAGHKCRRSGDGGPQTFLPAGGGPVQPIFINSSSIPSRGAKPRGADDARLPQGRPHEASSRGGKGTSRGARGASHDVRDQAGARRAPACVVSLFPLWCKGGKRRRGVPRCQAKVTISVQRDQDQQSGRTEVTAETKKASSPVPLAVEDQL